jgi:hypothetical protein
MQQAAIEGIGPLKLKYILPGAYCAIALLAWLDFSRLPPDGLSNVGLMLVALPATLLDSALRSPEAPGSFVLMPDSLGYYTNHAVFFVPSALIIAACFLGLGALLDRRRAARRAR